MELAGEDILTISYYLYDVLPNMGLFKLTGIIVTVAENGG